MSACVLLQGRRDPRFEEEWTRWLPQARESGLSSEDEERLRAAVVALRDGFRKRELDVIERVYRQLHALGSRSSSPTARAREELPLTTALEAGVTAARAAGSRAIEYVRAGAHRPPWPLPAESTPGRLAPLAAAACLGLGMPVLSDGTDLEAIARAKEPLTRVAHKAAAPPAGSRCPIPARLRRSFVVAARKTDLPLSLLVAVARAESHFDHTARSSAGAVGVLQLMPATARAMGVDPTDPHANVVGGARYLRSLFSRFDSPRLALAAYNAGPTRVAASAGALPRATRAYVATVKRTWRSLRHCR